MSQISKDGAIALRKNIQGPLKVIWEKLESAGIQNDCAEAYNHVWRFLEEVDSSWSLPGSVPEPKVVINGKEYRPRGDN
tara:strand:+ start:216 stop:452 length:237 start_codon:yes stop_codon:yes gene_type:complete